MAGEMQYSTDHAVDNTLSTSFLRLQNSYLAKTVKGQPSVKMQLNIGSGYRISGSDANLEKEINMNNLYHWHDEVMVELERREIDREIANANLLREAGLAGTDWLTQAVRGLGKLLKPAGRSPQNRHSSERQSYPSRSQKMAE